MTALAATALTSYAALSFATSFWVLISLNLIALTAQSALMPLGDTVTLAVSRSNGLDYGRIRVWGSVSFILASLASGAVLASCSEAAVLPLVLGASALLLLACLAVPRHRRPTGSSYRFAEMRGFVSDRRFWVFVLGASALQASHQVFTVSEPFTGARSTFPRRLSACFGPKASSPKSCCSGKVSAYWPGLARPG